jgi:enoyl-CoA hydratase
VIIAEQHERVTVLRLAHGKVNALDADLVEELIARFESLDRSSTGALVLTGEGRAFSAGVDLARYVESSPEEIRRFLRSLSILFETLFALPVPTVAAVNGAAIAGGCILACCCDRRLAAEGARIGATELAVGVAFPVAALEVLRHACGRRTEEVVVGAGIYQDEAAVAMGLVDEVVAPGELMERALAVATEWAARPAEPFRLAKLQLRRPILARIAADGASVDPDVAEVWIDPDTVARARASLESRSR